MKLNIGENIRKFRKQCDLTQEQLADKLGVSYQSVSRWENGATYPDMELLPVMAVLFDTTTDELLDIPNEKKEAAALETFNKLTLASQENPLDTEKIGAIIRDIRLNYLGSEHIYYFWLSVRNSIYRMPEILPEVRSFFEALMDSNTKPWNKNEAIVRMAINEDDEHIDKFIERYAVNRDLSKNALLSERYHFRNEWDKNEPLRQTFLFGHIDQLIGNRSLWSKPGDIVETEEHLPLLLQRNNLQLNLLHAFCGQTPDALHPVSGDGEVDFWVFERIFDLGLRRVGYLASSGDKEGAYVVLEDIIALLEKVMAITGSVELGCKSPWLDKFVWTAEESWSDPHGGILLVETQEREIYIHNAEGCCYVIYPSWMYEILSETSGVAYTQEWHWLDPLKGEERYNRCVERSAALIVRRKKPQE